MSELPTHELICVFCGADIVVSAGDNYCPCGGMVTRTRGEMGEIHDEWGPRT